MMAYCFPARDLGIVLKNRFSAILWVPNSTFHGRMGDSGVGVFFLSCPQQVILGAVNSKRGE